MVLTTFRVRISNIRCTELPQPSAGKTMNAYVKLNFDNFKTHETKVKPKDGSPTWPDDIAFTYSTKYADCLARKLFFLEVYDYNRFSAIETIGAARVDLHTLATGTVSHTLPLRDGRKRRGLIHFDVHMEQVSTVEISLRNLRLQGLTPDAAATAVTELALRVGEGGSTNKGASSAKSGAGETAWPAPDTLFMEGALKAVMASAIDVSIKGAKAFGSGALKFASHFSFVPGKPVEFELPLEPDAAIVGKELPVGAKLRLSGALSFTGFPVFCQLAGGLHTEAGIAEASFPFPSIPMRPACHVEVKEQPAGAAAGGAGAAPGSEPAAPAPGTLALPTLRKTAPAPAKLPAAEVPVVPLTEPLYRPGTNTAPSATNRLFAGAPGMPVCWIRRMDPAKPGAITFENLTTNTVEVELPTEVEYVVTIPPSATGSLGIAFEPNFSGVARHGWRSGRRNSGFDCGAVVRAVREGTYAATAVPRLRPGHHLVSVNGQSVLPLTFASTMTLLKATGRPMVLRFHDPYAVGVTAAATASNPGIVDMPGTVVGSQLPSGDGSKEGEGGDGKQEGEGGAGTGAGGSQAGIATQLAIATPGLRPGATMQAQPVPKRVAASAQRTLDMALEALARVDLHSPLLKAKEDAADEEAAAQAAAVQKAMADPGFIRSLNTIVTGVPRDTLPKDVANAVASAKKEGQSEADEEGADANAGGPKESPLTDDRTAERALNLLATITATTDADMAAKGKGPAYTPGVREQLKERATRMSEVGVFRRAVDSISSRNNSRFAGLAVKTVSTIMRVYDLAPKELGLDQSSLIGLQTQLRKADFGPMTAETHKLVHTLADENPDQDGLAFIQACIKAAKAVNAMTAAAHKRQKDAGAGGMPGSGSLSYLAGGAITKEQPKPVAEAMAALLDVDRRGRLLDDAAVVAGPDHLFEDLRKAIAGQLDDPYVACVFAATCGKLSAHPANAAFCVTAGLLPALTQIVGKHVDQARAAEGAAATFFNVGRDLENSVSLLEVGAAGRCCAMAKQWINHKTNAGGTPCAWPPAGHEAEVEEGVVFTGSEKYARDRNAVRPRLVRVCVNVLINLACYRQRGSDGLTSVDHIARAGGVPLLGECLRIHTSEPLVVTSVLNCAANIAFKNRDIQLALGERITDAVVLAGYQFTKDNNLLSMALRTIGNLTNQDENIYRTLGYGVVRMISSAMEINSVNVPLQNLAASVMSNIASVEPIDDASAAAYKELLVAARTARVSHPMPILQPTPSDADISGKLMASGKPVWAVADWLVLEEDGPKALIASMTMHSTDVAVVEACLRTLQCIASDDEVCAQMAQRLEAVNKTLFVMRAADFDVGVQLAGATLLQSFATNAGCAGLVLSSDTAHLLCSAADTHKSALLNGLAAATSALATLPATGNEPDAILNLLETTLEGGKAAQALQLIVRVFETLQLLAGPRAAKSVLELNTVQVTLSVITSLLSLLNAMSRKGFSPDLPPNYDPLLQTLLGAVHAGCVLLSVWAQGRPPTAIGQAGWDDVDTLRTAVTGADRTFTALNRFAELCTIGTGQPGDPSMPAVALKAARAVVDAMAACLITSDVLPGRTGPENPPKPGVRTLADQRAVESLVRAGGVKTAGALMLAHATAAVRRGAESPLPDVSALTSRMLTAQLLVLLDLMGCYVAPSMPAATAATAATNPEVAAQLAADPVANAAGMSAAAAGALQAVVVSNPAIPAMDMTPSPCKLVDLADVAGRVAAHLNAHFSAPEPAGAGGIVPETEAAAIFCYSISRAAQQIVNAGQRMMSMTPQQQMMMLAQQQQQQAAAAAAAAGGMGGMPPGAMPGPPGGPPPGMPPGAMPGPPGGAPPPMGAPGGGIHGGMMLSPGGAGSPAGRAMRPSMAVQAPMAPAVRTVHSGGMHTTSTTTTTTVTMTVSGDPSGDAAALAAMAAAAAAAGGAGAPAGAAAAAAAGRGGGLKRMGSKRGFLGRLATDAGFPASAWIDGKAKPVVVKAPADGSAVMVMEPSKAAIKARKSMAPGVVPPPAAMELTLLARLEPRDFSDVRVGGIMVDGTVRKQGGFFKSGPKVANCVCLDDRGDTIFQLEMADPGEAEEMRTALLHIAGSA